jgi:hypothetical protein
LNWLLRAQNGGETSYSVWVWNMGNGRDGYEENEYMGGKYEEGYTDWR